MIYRYWSKIYLSFICVIATTFSYRPIFKGQLLGDPFDARLQIVLHEHWWRWINGLVDLRDTEFFFPFKLALGYSDVFFVQGILYSFFRFINLNLANSWIITTFLLVLLGNLSWVFVAEKYIKNSFFKVMLILISTTSLSFVYYFSLNPNILGYAYLPWIVLFVNNIKYEKNTNKKQIKIGSFIILFIIYALSCWYGAFFAALTLIIKFLIDINLNLINFKNIFYKKINYAIIFCFLPFQLFFLWLFYYIYVTVSNQPFRPVDELIQRSPKIEYLGNGASINSERIKGALFKDFYFLTGLDVESESFIGIGFVLFFILCFIILYKIIFDIKFFRKQSLLTAILLTYLYFVEFNDFSIHKVFFEIVPGFNSIRSPSRYVILVGFIVIFIAIYLIDQLYSRAKGRGIQLLLISLSIIILIDQIRAPFQGWERKQLTNSDLVSKKDEILKKCDYFYYDVPGGWWYDQIEAITFAVQAGIPTVNGYSGAFPPGYPFENFNSEANPFKIFDWISQINKDLRGCFINGPNPIKFLNQKINTIDKVGFVNMIGKQSAMNYLAVSPNPYLYIVNYSKNIVSLNFTIKSSKCDKNQAISVLENGINEIFRGNLDQENKTIDLQIDFRNQIVSKIDIITNSESCYFDKQNIDYYFEIEELYIK